MVDADEAQGRASRGVLARQVGTRASTENDVSVADYPCVRHRQARALVKRPIERPRIPRPADHISKCYTIWGARTSHRPGVQLGCGMQSFALGINAAVSRSVSGVRRHLRARPDANRGGPPFACRPMKASRRCLADGRRERCNTHRTSTSFCYPGAAILCPDRTNVSEAVYDSVSLSRPETTP